MQKVNEAILVPPILNDASQAVNVLTLQMWTDIVTRINEIKTLGLSHQNMLAVLCSISDQVQCEIAEMQAKQSETATCSGEMNNTAAAMTNTCAAADPEITFTYEQIQRLQYVAGIIKG
jgi:hypothetical protein